MLKNYIKYINDAKLFNNRKLIVINYHRIYKDKLFTNFDEGVFGPSINEFKTQMKWLKQNTDILSEDEIIHHIKNNKEFKRCSVLITFDDGYIDNYSIVFPILKSFNIPSIFFIPTDLIEERRLGWWDIIYYLIKKCNKNKIIIDSNEILISNNKKGKINAIRQLRKIMRSIKASKSIELLKNLSQECEVDFPKFEEQSAELMTWDQIIEISKQRMFAIGSHTHSHHILTNLDESEQISELQKSKSILEDKLNMKIKSMSYPDGSYFSFSDRIKEFVQGTGFSIAFSFNTGVNQRRITDCFNIKRISPPNNLFIFKMIIR